MLTFAGTYVMKLMLRWGWGWGGVGHVNVRWHLRHEVDATLGMGVGWGGACYRALALTS